VLPLAIALVVAHAGIPAAVRAGEGVLEISQACVASGCLPGDPPGAPVIVGQPGSYRLTSNLFEQDRSRSVIRLTADDVALDLGGFVIDYPATGGGVGVAIDGSGSNRSTVRNGTVKDAGGDCIRLGNRARVERVVVSGCGGRGMALAGGAIVRESQVEDTGTQGIEAQGSPLIVDNFVIRAGRQDTAEGIAAGVAALLRGNVVRLGSGPGILVGKGSNVAGNVSQGNAGFGIFAGPLSAVLANTTVENIGGGIVVGVVGSGRGSSPGLVARNVASEGFYGIWAGGLVADNLATSNSFGGLFAPGGTGVGGNVFNDNNDEGDQIRPSAPFPAEEIVENVCQEDQTCP